MEKEKKKEKEENGITMTNPSWGCVNTIYINVNCRTHKAPRDLKFGMYANKDLHNKPYDTTPRLDPSI